MRSQVVKIVLAVLVFCAAFYFKPAFVVIAEYIPENTFNLSEQNLMQQHQQKEIHDKKLTLEKIAFIKSEAQEELKKEFLSFAAEMERYQQTIQPRLQAACANSAKKLSEYGSCWEIVKKLAADQISDASRAERFIASKIESRIGPVLAETANAVDAMMVDYSKRIKMISLKTFEKIYNLPGAIEILGFEPGLQSFEMQAEEVRSLCTTTTSDCFFQILGNSFQLLQTKIVRELIMHAVVAARDIFNKQIRRLAGSFSLAILDGPLPIGDLLACGSTVFVAYDINRKKKKYRRKIEGLLSMEAAASLGLFFKGCLEDAQRIESEAHNMLENAVENLSKAVKA